MDPRALELLELPAILDRLAAEAASEPGKDRSLALVPSGDPDEVDRRQSLTREAIDLFERSEEPDVADVRDVRHTAEVAARGSALDTYALRSIATSIVAATAARASIVTAGDAPGLEELAAGVDRALVRLSEPIARAVEDDGSDLRDGASPALRRLRRELREGRGRITERLRALARDPALREHLSGGLRHRARPAGPCSRSAPPPAARCRASSTTSRAPGRRCSSSRFARRRGLQPPPRGRERRARGGRADPARALACCRRPGGRDRQPRGGDRRDRSRLRVRPPLAALAGSGGDAQPTSVALRGARHPLLDPATAVPIDLELGALRARSSSPGRTRAARPSR